MQIWSIKSFPIGKFMKKLILRTTFFLFFSFPTQLISQENIAVSVFNLPKEVSPLMMTQTLFIPFAIR